MARYRNQTADVILDRMKSRIDDSLDKRQGSIIHDMLSPSAIELEQAYMELDNVLDWAFADTTYGEYLDRRVSEVGLKRKAGESDDDLLKRYYDRVQHPFSSANANHYRLLAQEVAGVYDARVYPIWNGPGTVRVVVLATDKKPPSDNVISAVTQHIKEQQPVGAIVTIDGARQVLIDIDVKLTLREDADIELAREQITQRATEYLAELAFNELIVRIARFGDIILNADDVIDYEDLKINGKTSNIQIQDHEVAVLGRVTITI